MILIPFYFYFSKFEVRHRKHNLINVFEFEVLCDLNIPKFEHSPFSHIPVYVANRWKKTSHEFLSLSQ